MSFWETLRKIFVIKIQDKIPVFCAICVIIFCASVLSNTNIATAVSPPSIINYQGKLLDSGVAVDATTSMKFLIYDDPTGGALQYTAGGTIGAPDTVDVPVTSGIFSINLGDSGTNTVTSSIFSENNSLYLEVWVGGQVLTPRKHITATPYAINSMYLMGYSALATSTAAYIPLADSHGNLMLSGDPQSDAVEGGSLFVNPLSAGVNETLLGVADAGTERFRVDKEGDAWFSGAVTATGTATSSFSNVLVNNGLTLGGVTHTTWPVGGTGDVVAASDNIFTGQNTFETTSTFNGVGVFTSTTAFSVTSTMADLVVNGGITLGGVERTTWANGDVIAANDNGFLGANTFAATSTFNGLVNFTSTTAFSVTSTMANLVVNGGITLGGVERTTWPGGGAGDVVAAGDNTFTGINTFATTTLATTTISEVSVTQGITLGGVRHTSWPGGVAAGDENTFTATNTFDGVSHLNGYNSVPQFSGWLGANVNLDGLTGIVLQNQYAYVLSYDIDTFVVVDMSDKTSPSVLSTLTSASLDGPQSLAIQGNYAYVVAKAGSALAIIDISDPKNPTLVSSGTYGLSTPESVAVSGNYAYVASGGNDKMIVVDISNPYAPSAVGSITHGGSVLLDNPKDILVSGKYVYLAAHDSDALTIVDVSNPASPTWVSSATGGAFGIHGPRTLATFGKYVYIGSDVSDDIEIADISDISNPTYVSSFNRGGGMDDVYSLVATKDFVYAYLIFINGIIDDTALLVLDVRTPSSPSEYAIQAANAGDTANGPRSLSIQGNWAYLATHSYAQAGGGGDELDGYNISGAIISNADIGNTTVSNLSVLGDTNIEGKVNVRNGLSVGNNGFLLNGSFSMFAATSSLASTNTLRFSHTALFETNASTTDDHAFIFNTKNSLTLSASQYLFSVRNNGTPTFSIATNGDVHTTGTYYGAAVAVSTPGAPGDLAERVDIAIDDEVEPGDVVVVDPHSTDTYRKSTSPYAAEVSGVISTQPSIVVGDGKTEHTAVMAMVGRVPIKVSAENGPIVRGDLLITASSTGYAMRYDPTKDMSDHIAGIVGVALESLPAGKGKIVGLVRTGWVSGAYRQTFDELRSELSKLALTQTNLQNNEGVNVSQNQDGTIHRVDSDLNVNGFSLLAVRSISGLNDKWHIDENGRFTSTVDTSGGTKTLYALQSGESQYVFSGNAVLSNGKIRVDFSSTTLDIVDVTKPISINLTLTQKAKGVYVSHRDATGFEVEELDGGTSNATFDWLVFATRKESSEEVLPENTDERGDASESDSDSDHDVSDVEVNDAANTPTETPTDIAPESVEETPPQTTTEENSAPSAEASNEGTPPAETGSESPAPAEAATN